MKRVHFENVAMVACLLAAAIILTATPELGEKLRLHADSEGLLLAVQLLTCHLVHWTAAHLFYDALCLAVLGLLLSRQELLLTLLFAAPIVAITALWLHPELSSYCGLSGVNCALFAYFAVKIGRERKLLGAVALTAILLKTGVEIHSGHTFFATDGFIPVHSAHLVGIMVGVICGALESCSLESQERVEKLQNVL